MRALFRIGWCYKGFCMPKDSLQALLILLYNVTLFMIFSWLFLCNIFHVWCCATIQWSRLFCCMTPVRQLSIPAFGRGEELDCYSTVHTYLLFFWRAYPYLDKIVCHYLLGSCWVNVVLSLVRSGQWFAQTIPFWTYYICCVVYSGSAVNLLPCPIIKSSIWCLEEKRNSFRS